MTLTSGRGPLTPDPAGRFVPPLPPEPRAFVEPFRRRVQATVGGRIVVDSERVVLVHRPGHPPTYAFPVADVGRVHHVPTAEVEGYVEVAWDAVDQWREEGEPVLLHVRNPYHRVDCLRTSRRLRVELAGVTVVDTRDTVVLYETGLEPKLYVARAQLHDVGLVRSDTATYCPYKGTATWWDAVVGDTRVDAAVWSYEDPLPESATVKGLLSFEPARATIEHDVPAPAF